MGELRVVVLEPNRLGVEVIIDGELETLQRLVGGYVEAVQAGDYVVLCNEEGKLKGLPFNCKLGGHEFVGVIVLTKPGPDDEFASLTDLLHANHSGGGLP